MPPKKSCLNEKKKNLSILLCTLEKGQEGCFDCEMSLGGLTGASGFFVVLILITKF